MGGKDRQTKEERYDGKKDGRVRAGDRRRLQGKGKGGKEGNDRGMEEEQ